MNIQEVFAKVSSSVGGQMKSVIFAMHELDKNQSANCSVHAGLILDSQDFSSSKTIAPPSVSVTIVLPSVSKTISLSLSKHQSVSQHRCFLWGLNAIF